MACRFWSAPAIIWIEASRAAEAQRHSQRISDAQRSQIATPLDGLDSRTQGGLLANLSTKVQDGPMVSRLQRGIR